MPDCHGDPRTAAFNNVTPYLIRGQPVAPRPARGEPPLCSKTSALGPPSANAWAHWPTVWASRSNACATAAVLQPPCRGTGQALGQQPHRVPPFPLPGRRRSVHPSPHFRLVHAQQQPPLRFPDPFRPSRPLLSYPNPMRVSPWRRFSITTTVRCAASGKLRNARPVATVEGIWPHGSQRAEDGAQTGPWRRPPGPASPASGAAADAEYAMTDAASYYAAPPRCFFWVSWLVLGLAPALR